MKKLILALVLVAGLNVQAGTSLGDGHHTLSPNGGDSYVVYAGTDDWTGTPAQTLYAWDGNFEFDGSCYTDSLVTYCFDGGKYTITAEEQIIESGTVQ